jgi:hypothetical protein
VFEEEDEEGREDDRAHDHSKHKGDGAQDITPRDTLEPLAEYRFRRGKGPPFGEGYVRFRLVKVQKTDLLQIVGFAL